MASLLEPGRAHRRRSRRRRERGRRLVVLVVIGAVAASVGLVARGHGSRGAPAKPPSATVKPSHAKPRHTAPKVAAAPAPVPLLTGVAAKHAFSPRLGARAAILVDPSNGKVLWSLRPHERRPIASLTKIMTATLVLERLPLDTMVKIDWTVPRVPAYREGLRVGESVRAEKLLYALLVYSGNDDALALAIAAGGSRKGFISLMNQKAAALDLRDTHFNSTSGVVDTDNYSSAYDLAALTRYAFRDARFRKIVRTRVKKVSWAAPTYSKIYVTKNHFLTLYPGADGVKTGWTTLSGPCVVASATRHGKTLIAVVINSPRKYNDAARLLNYGYATLG